MLAARKKLRDERLPLRVVMNYTQNYNGFGVRLGAGCVGDGTNAIDLVLNVNGDGLTNGPQEDAIRVMNERPGASNLQINGYANCGRKVISSIHQDGIQVLGGTNITWMDFQVGNYDAGRSTCQGAGGAFFYSETSTNTRVQGGKYIACNHSLLAGSGSGSRLRSELPVRAERRLRPRVQLQLLASLRLPEPEHHPRVGSDLPAMEPHDRPLGERVAHHVI